MKIFAIGCVMFGVFSANAQKLDSNYNYQNAKHDYYSRVGEYVIHYHIEVKADTVLMDIPLTEKKTITSRAELVNKKGKIIFLDEGQCIDSKGSFVDCNEVRRKLRARTEKIYPLVPEQPPVQLSSFNKNE